MQICTASPFKGKEVLKTRGRRSPALREPLPLTQRASSCQCWKELGRRLKRTPGKSAALRLDSGPKRDGHPEEEGRREGAAEGEGAPRRQRGGQARCSPGAPRWQREGARAMSEGRADTGRSRSPEETHSEEKK